MHFHAYSVLSFFRYITNLLVLRAKLNAKMQGFMQEEFNYVLEVTVRRLT